MTNEKYLKELDGVEGVKFYDVKSAVEDITPGSFEKLNYTSRVLAENLIRKCPSEDLEDSLVQLIEKRTDKDFPWFPSRVICHDILGLTAFVDLAGLREAVASKGGNPDKVNPVVPTQLIVDHSLAVECGGFDPDAFQKIEISKIEEMQIDSTLLTGQKKHLITLMLFLQEMVLCTKST